MKAIPIQFPALSIQMPNFASALGKMAQWTQSSSGTGKSVQHYKKHKSRPIVQNNPVVKVIQPQPQSISSSESKQSPVIASPSARQATFVSLLEKLHRVEEIKESLPPRGSYTPYGERTIIMIKYPGLPERRRITAPATPGLSVEGSYFGKYSLGGVKTVSVTTVDDWNTPSARPIKLKDPDVGVVISQNYILQPDVSMNSHYAFDHQTLRVPARYDDHSSEDDAVDTDMVSLLAKTLAERNRLINTFIAKKAAADGKYNNKQWGNAGPKKEPPFVLIHLETFTKKRNNTTPFGFAEERESSFSNGTIIYPTLDDPTVLASTKFEFDGAKDIEAVFDRPLGNECN
jgi:hypothetical protein